MKTAYNNGALLDNLQDHAVQGFKCLHRLSGNQSGYQKIATKEEGQIMPHTVTVSDRRYRIFISKLISGSHLCVSDSTVLFPSHQAIFYDIITIKLP